MICPNCKSETRTVDSARVDERTKRRRRECPICAVRFTTFEVSETAWRLIQAVRKDAEAGGLLAVLLAEGRTQTKEVRRASA